MYSMVLMMAMTSSPEAAACHPKGCQGGCQGVVYAGCQGASCFGSSCHGGGLFKSGCHGGGLFKSSCHGSVYTSCTGYSCFGGGSCHGGLFARRSHSCCGSTAPVYTGCTGGCIGAPPVVNPAPKDMPKVEPKKGGVTSAPAFITVNVPADAKISIDGAATKSVSAVRTFSTPELNAGTVYYYTLTAEVVRGGKTYTATEKVAVEAGATAQITLNPNVGPAVASK